MNSLKIECFLAVAEAKSFSKAADLLYKNQSVISRQIAALERELGEQLFERGPRGTTLTMAGEAFKAGMLKISTMYQKVMEDVHAVGSGYIGDVKIFTHPGNLYFEDLVQIVLAFETAHPEIHISLDTAYHGDIGKMLNEQQTDLAFWRWEEYASERRERMYVSTIESGLLTLADHPFLSSGKERPELKDFKDDTFIVLAENIAPRLGYRLMRQCLESGFEPKMVTAPELDTSLLWVSARRGIMAANSHCIGKGHSAFRFIVLPQMGLSEFYFIWDKYNDNPCLKVFLDFVDTFIPKKLNQ